MKKIKKWQEKPGEKNWRGKKKPARKIDTKTKLCACVANVFSRNELSLSYLTEETWVG